MMIRPLFLLLAVFQSRITETTGFAVATGNSPQVEKSIPAFREVLRQAGKKVFRPGGSQAAEKLHSWARKIDKNSNAIEFATGPGTGIDFAIRTGCKLLITDPDESRLQVVAESAKERDLLDNVDFKKVDLASTIELLDGQHFDAAMVEAVLTKYPREQKMKILKDLHGITDQLLLHEICIRGCEKDESPCAAGVKETVGSALKTGYNPLTTNGWIHVLEQSGFGISDIETGSIRLVKPSKSSTVQEFFRQFQRASLWFLV
jgi:hypothetical protein